MTSGIYSQFAELRNVRETDRRQRFRFWMEFLGIMVTVLSLLFVGFQINQQHRQIEIQTVLDIEDSERFINQLAMSKPELSLLLENAGAVIDVHARIPKCEKYSNSRAVPEIHKQIPVLSTVLDHSLKGIGTCGEKEKTEADFKSFIEEAEKLMHLLPVSQVVDYYETIQSRQDQMSSLARFQALRALIEQLRARVNTAGYIMLQEFEKMFRVCQKEIIDEAFWRGPNAFEHQMQEQLQREPLITMLKESKTISGFHPEFISYAKNLAQIKDSASIDDSFKKQYCSFKSDYWLIPGMI